MDTKPAHEWMQGVRPGDRTRVPAEDGGKREGAESESYDNASLRSIRDLERRRWHPVCLEPGYGLRAESQGTVEEGNGDGTAPSVSNGHRAE